jgi:SAM-dependent methyltransferase
MAPAPGRQEDHATTTEGGCLRMGHSAVTQSLETGDALSHELSTAALLINYHAWIFREVAPFLGFQLTEIGGGLGTFSDLLLRHHLAGRPNASLDIFEPDPTLFAQLRATCLAQQAELMRADRLRLTNGCFTSKPNAYDSAVLVNVLEHVRDDSDLIQEIYASLHPGGTLVVFSPALPSLYSALDKEVGHFRRYRKAELASLFRHAGFDILKLRYMDAAGIIPWYVINVLAGSCSFNPQLIRMYDRFVVPIMSRLECYGAPLGKNLLIVGRKPSGSLPAKAGTP